MGSLAPPNGDPVRCEGHRRLRGDNRSARIWIALLPFFDVMAVHKQWLSLPTPRA